MSVACTVSRTADVSSPRWECLDADTQTSSDGFTALSDSTTEVL